MECNLLVGKLMSTSNGRKTFRHYYDEWCTVADLGQSVQFLNFHNVIRANACTGCVAWGPFLASIMSHYTAADMLLMNKAMGKLPNNFGSKAAKKELYNVAYATYYKATGLDLETNRPATEVNAEWAEKYEFK